jgi:hypothetical protein
MSQGTKSVEGVIITYVRSGSAADEVGVLKRMTLLLRSTGKLSREVSEIEDAVMPAHKRKIYRYFLFGCGEKTMFFTVRP